MGIVLCGEGCVVSFILFVNPFILLHEQGHQGCSLGQLSSPLLSVLHT